VNSKSPERMLYLLDLSSLLFRFFYGTPLLITKDGRPTNAVYGVLRLLIKLASENPSADFLVLADSGRETFRKEILQDYKSNRKEAPEELKVQIPLCESAFETLGLKICKKEGFEADDLIAGAVKFFKDKYDRCVIVSQDKDLSQLVDEKVALFDVSKNKIMGPEDIKKNFGVFPDKIPLFLALVGDSSDNIPGIKGIGPKTAAKLIEQFESLEDLLEPSSSPQFDVRNHKMGKFLEILRQNADQVKKNLLLTDLKKVDVSFEFEPKPWKPTPEFFNLLEDLEFKSILNTLHR